MLHESHPPVSWRNYSCRLPLREQHADAQPHRAQASGPHPEPAHELSLRARARPDRSHEVSSYQVKELFRTLQGEGANAGRVAVFCRFTGCNLWSGNPRDRAIGRGDCSRWCDTEFVGTDGEGGGKFHSAEALAAAARHSWEHEVDGDLRPLFVGTGGEPLLQLDTALVGALHERGFEVAIETNGSLAVPEGVDWVCVSPKAGSELIVTRGQELKLVMPQEGIDPADYLSLDFTHRFIQPKDGPDKEKDLQLALDYCLAHPQWRLSLQSHKFIGIP